MSETHIGSRQSHLDNQWQLDQHQTDAVRETVKSKAITDQMVKADITQAPVQAQYTQDARFPKLVEPPPQNDNLSESGEQKSNEGENFGSGILQTSMPRPPPPGQPKQDLAQMSENNGSLDENSVNQFAKQNNVSPEATRLAYAFAKANPDVPLSPPFNQVTQFVQPQSLTQPEANDLQEQGFNTLLEGDEAGLQQLAQKLGVTPDQARQMVMDAHSQGTSDNPDVQQYTQNLNDQASGQTKQQLGDQAFNRALFNAGNNVNQLAQSLGKTPEEVQQMVQQAKADPEAPVPDSVKTFTQQLQTVSQQLGQPPAADPEGEFNALLNSTSGPVADQVNQLATQLGVTPEQAKQMLSEAATNPTPDMPPVLVRTAESLMQKADSNATSKALTQMAGQIFDSKIAQGGGKIAQLAKMLGMSEDQVKMLLQKAMGNSGEVPKEVTKLANQLMKESMAMANLKGKGLMGGKDINKAVGQHHNQFFSNAMKNMNLDQATQTKVLFAKQNPELKSQLDPETVNISESIDQQSKDALEQNMGVPKTFDPPAGESLTQNIASTTYDDAFEGQVQNMLSDGKATPQDVAQLRMMHYNPDTNFPASPAVQTMFQQIQNSIMPEVRTQLGAPPTFSPKPGADLFSATMNGEVGLEINDAISQLKQGGKLTSDQAEMVQQVLSGQSTASSQEVQDLVNALLNSSVKNVADKFGLRPSDINSTTPLASGNVDPQISKLMKNGLNMATEAANNFKNAAAAAPNSPLQVVYAKFLILVNLALETAKLYSYQMTSGDASRAKNSAIQQLEKSMAQVAQQKRAFAKRDEALAKAAAMSILMIFLFMILAIIMAILAAVLIGGIIGLLIAILLIVMETINAILSAVKPNSAAAKVFDAIVMALEMITGIGAALMAPMKAVAKIVEEVVEKELKQVVKMTMANIMNIIKNVVVEVAKEAGKGLKSAVKEFKSAIKEFAKDVKSQIESAMSSLSGAAGGAGEAGGAEAGTASKSMTSKLMESLDKFAKVDKTADMPPSQLARVSELSTPSKTLTEAVSKAMGRSMEVLFNELKSIASGIGEAVMNALKSPLETLKGALSSVKDMGSTTVDLFKTDVVKPVTDEAGNVVKNAEGKIKTKLNWTHDWGDEKFANSEGALKLRQAQMVTETGATVTSGMMGVTEGLKNKAENDATVIQEELDAQLEYNMMVIKMLTAIINAIMAALAAPLEDIKSIGKMQGDLFSKMSQATSGINSAGLQG